MPDRLEGVEVQLGRADLKEDLSQFVNDLTGLELDIRKDELGGLHARKDNFRDARKNSIQILQNKRDQEIAADPTKESELKIRYEERIKEKEDMYSGLEHLFGPLQDMRPFVKDEDGVMKVYITIPKTNRQRKKLIRKLKRESEDRNHIEGQMATAGNYAVDARLSKETANVYAPIIAALHTGQAGAVIPAGVNISTIQKCSKRPVCGSGVDYNPGGGATDFVTDKLGINATEGQKERFNQVATLATGAVAIYGAYQALFKGGTERGKRWRGAYGLYGTAALGMYIYGESIKAPHTIVREILGGGDSYNTISGAFEKVLGVGKGTLGALRPDNALQIMTGAQTATVMGVLQTMSPDQIKTFVVKKGNTYTLVDKNKDGQADLAVFLQSQGKKDEAVLVQNMFGRQDIDNTLTQGIALMGVDIYSGNIEGQLAKYSGRTKKLNKYLEKNKVEIGDKQGIILMEEYYAGKISLSELTQALLKNELLIPASEKQPREHISAYDLSGTQSILDAVKDRVLFDDIFRGMQMSDFVTILGREYVYASHQDKLTIDRDQMNTLNPDLRDKYQGKNEEEGGALQLAFEQKMHDIMVNTIGYNFDDLKTNAERLSKYATVGEFLETQSVYLENYTALTQFANQHHLVLNSDDAKAVELIRDFITNNDTATPYGSIKARYQLLESLRETSNMFDYFGEGYTQLGITIPAEQYKAEVEGISAMPESMKEGYATRATFFANNELSKALPTDHILTQKGAAEIDRTAYGRTCTIHRKTGVIVSQDTEGNDIQHTVNPSDIANIMQQAHILSFANTFRYSTKSHAASSFDNGEIVFENYNSGLEWFQDLLSGNSVGERKGLKGGKIDKELIANMFPSVLMSGVGKQVSRTINRLGNLHVTDDPEILEDKIALVRRQLLDLNREYDIYVDISDDRTASGSSMHNVLILQAYENNKGKKGPVYTVAGDIVETELDVFDNQQGNGSLLHSNDLESAVTSAHALLRGKIVAAEISMLISDTASGVATDFSKLSKKTIKMLKDVGKSIADIPGATIDAIKGWFK